MCDKNVVIIIIAFFSNFFVGRIWPFLLLSIRFSVVGIVRLVVHDQLVVDKLEAVGARLERILDHDGNRLLVEPGELVDVLAGVLAVGDAEPKVKVEGLEVLVPEKVSLYHAKILKMVKVYSRSTTGKRESFAEDL